MGLLIALDEKELDKDALIWIARLWLVRLLSGAPMYASPAGDVDT